MNLTTTKQAGYVVNVQSFAEAMEFAKMLANTDMVPEGDQGKPGNILAKMQKGAEVGMPPMLAIGKLYIVRGRVGMEVMAMLSIVESSGLLENRTIERLQDATGEIGCRVTVQRKGRAPHVVTFTREDAIRAGLTTGRNKDLYRQWDFRMYQNRALGFALQDEFPDVLGGMVSLESLKDGGVITDSDGDIDGRPVDVQVLGDQEQLAAQAVELMERLRLRPAQRLAKLTAYRGRVPELIETLKADLDKAALAPPAPAPAVPVTVTVTVEPAPTPAPEPPPDPAPAPVSTDPACTACGARNYGNPECDSCIDMQLVQAEA